MQDNEQNGVEGFIYEGVAYTFPESFQPFLKLCQSEEGMMLTLIVQPMYPMPLALAN